MIFTMGIINELQRVSNFFVQCLPDNQAIEMVVVELRYVSIVL